jgi:hypothetical protein
MHQSTGASGGGTREGSYNERTANFLTQLAEQARRGQLQGVAVLSVEGEGGSNPSNWQPKIGTFSTNAQSAEKLNMLIEKARMGLVETWPSEAPQFSIPGF